MCSNAKAYEETDIDLVAGTLLTPVCTFHLVLYSTVTHESRLKFKRELQRHVRLKA